MKGYKPIYLELHGHRLKERRQGSGLLLGCFQVFKLQHPQIILAHERFTPFHETLLQLFTEVCLCGHIWLELKRKNASKHEYCIDLCILTSEDSNTWTGGATKMRTFVSSISYFALPRITCRPGAPVLPLPGRTVCRFPAVKNE